MNYSKVNKWEKLPKHIIINIANYLPFIFQLELRQLSKHWKFNLNSLVFHSLTNYKSNNYKLIINNYGNYIKLINQSILAILEVDKVKDLCPNIQYVKLVLTTSTIEKSLELIKYYQNNLLSLELTNYIEDNETSNVNLKNFFNTLYSLKYLTSFNYSSIGRFKHPLPKFSSFKNLTNLKIRSGSLNYYSILEEIESLKDLRELNWEINYYGSANNFRNRNNLIAPNSLLINNKLNSLTLSNLHYFDNGESIEIDLSKSFSNLFTNPKFFKLSKLNWILIWSGNNLKDLFSDKLPKTRIWPNLTKLSLFTVDKYLLNYIIEHMPNLIELVALSPLTLPYCDDAFKLKPLIKLKRLLVGGISSCLVGNENITQHLFPNVETLNTSYNLSSELNDDSIMDAYYIPLLFKNLKCCILSSPDYSLDNLINNYTEELKWEELFIYINQYNYQLLDLLFDKLTYIKFIYFNSRSFNNLKIIKRKGIRYFKADIDDDNNDFGFTNIIEI